ncbi:MAG: permease prefix domain 1-containing protein [Clostridium paraputrificum]
MFNLDESIKYWRNDLNKNDVLSLDDLEELESHLMDEITVLKEKDLSEEEAFLVAKSRIGQNDIIEEEYKKVNRNEIGSINYSPFYYFISFNLYYLIGTNKTVQFFKIPNY